MSNLAPSYPLPNRIKKLMADRLFEERKRMGLSQQKFADRLGIPLYKYRQYENGEIDISLDLLWIAYSWETDIQYIITGYRSRFLITDHHREQHEQFQATLSNT